MCNLLFLVLFDVLYNSPVIHVYTCVFLRVVVIVQGLVILRWLPLMYCPFPPAAGHGDLHDIGGATVHHEPLSRSTREDLFAETLKLLRGQNNMSVERENSESVPPTTAVRFCQYSTFITTTITTTNNTVGFRSLYYCTLLMFLPSRDNRGVFIEFKQHNGRDVSIQVVACFFKDRARTRPALLVSLFIVFAFMDLTGRV